MRQWLAWVLLAVSVSANVWFLCCRRVARGYEAATTVRDTVRMVDTVRVRVPVVLDVAAAGAVVARLERVGETGDTLTRREGRVEESADTLTRRRRAGDTVSVLVPMERRVYGDSTYTAWVSGYRARLDSIAVYRRREVVTVRERQHRWSVGLQAGYGFTPGGLGPYVGIGVTWRLW